MKKFKLLLFIFVFFVFSCSTIASNHHTVGYNGSMALPALDPVCENISAILPPQLPRPAVSRATDSGKSIRFLNWNAHKGVDQGWLKDFQELSSQADIIALQEGNLTDSLVEALNTNRLTWDLADAFHYREAPTGVLTASRMTPLSLCSFRMTEPLLPVPKTGLATRYMLPSLKEPLLVINVHMINFTLSTAPYMQYLLEIENIIKEHHGPVILTGDFNTWSSKRTGQLKEMSTRLGLAAVHFDNDLRTRFFGQVVDWVYLRGLTPVEQRVLPLSSSDHNPLLITLTPSQDSLSIQ